MTGQVLDPVRTVLLIVAAVISAALGAVTAPATDPDPVRASALPSFRSAEFRLDAADLPASYRPGCPVPPSSLRLLHPSYVGFDGREHLGRLVVAAAVADDVTQVFRTLYEERFPIASMRPVDDFGGSDDASMAANNTSAFNCRAVTGGSSFSEHSYGTAIDVNPVQNPYVSGGSVQPDAGAEYLDRSDLRPGMIVDGDAVVAAFAAVGWSWGGHWSAPVDYQHFSLSGR